MASGFDLRAQVEPLVALVEHEVPEPKEVRASPQASKRTRRERRVDLERVLGLPDDECLQRRRPRPHRERSTDLLASLNRDVTRVEAEEGCIFGRERLAVGAGVDETSNR